MYLSTFKTLNVFKVLFKSKLPHPQKFNTSLYLKEQILEGEIACMKQSFTELRLHLVFL